MNDKNESIHNNPNHNKNKHNQSNHNKEDLQNNLIDVSDNKEISELLNYEDIDDDDLLQEICRDNDSDNDVIAGIDIDKSEYVTKGQEGGGCDGASNDDEILDLSKYDDNHYKKKHKKSRGGSKAKGKGRGGSKAKGKGRGGLEGAKRGKRGRKRKGRGRGGNGDAIHDDGDGQIGRILRRSLRIKNK